GGDPTAIDAATRRVRDERWPEIVAVQQMQQHQARILFAPDRWSTRLMNRLLPWLVRTGLLSLLQRQEDHGLSDRPRPVRVVGLGRFIQHEWGGSVGLFGRARGGCGRWMSGNCRLTASSVWSRWLRTVGSWRASRTGRNTPTTSAPSTPAPSWPWRRPRPGR